jgi:hypothetical protein
MKFKCIQSGNTVEFFQDHEIAEMRKHAGYAEVVEAPAETAKSTSKKTVKQDEDTINGS